MKNKPLQHTLMLLISLLPIARLLIVWASVPAIVPTHFGSDMKPNDYSSKFVLLGICAIIAGVSLLVYFLMQYIHKIDPKRAARVQSTVFNTLGIGVVLFLTALNFVATQMSLSGGKVAENALMPLLGLLFVFLGIIMPRLEPNYFAGIRIPWTLHSDYNWRKTHELAGKVWTVCGILITILALVLPATAAAYLMLSFLPLLIGIPIVYSFILFRREQANPGIAQDSRG